MKITKKLVHFLNQNFYFFSIGIIFLFLLPFLCQSFFTIPQTDDLNYSMISSDFWGNNIQHFLHTNGRYFATLIISGVLWEHPINLGVYHIYVFASILFFILGLIFIFKKGLGLCYKISIFLGSSISLLYFSLQPLISNSMYWISANVTYVLSMGFFFSYLALILNGMKKEYQWNLVSKILLFVLTFMLIGFFEYYIIILCGIVFYTTVYFWRTQKRFHRFLISLTVFSLILGTLVFIFGGNLSRADILHEVSEPMSHPEKLKAGVLSFLKWSIIWLKGSSIYFLCLLSSITFYKITHKNFKKDLPWLVIFTLGLIFLIFLMFYLPYAISGKAAPFRTYNFIFFFFISTLLLTTYIFIQLLKSEIELKVGMDLNLVKYPVLFLFLIGLVYETQWSTATLDLYTGKSCNYLLEWKERDEIIKNSKSPNVGIPPFKNKPKSIYFKDFPSSRAYELYYKKDSIYIIQQP